MPMPFKQTRGAAPGENLILQIIPHARKAGDGVASYAEILGTRIHERHHARSIFIVNHNESFNASESNDIISIDDEISLDHLINSDVKITGIIIHYSGYGYHPLGFPFWLFGFVKRLKNRIQGSIRVVGVMHEIHSGIRPLRKASLLVPLQALASRLIAFVSDSVIVTNQHYESILLSMAVSREKLVQTPVFSNLGEPSDISNAPQVRRLAIIGNNVDYGAEPLTDTRFIRFLAQMEIEEIFDIGRREKQVPAESGCVKITSHGFLSDTEVSAKLKECVFGLMPYPRYGAHLAGKSGLIAAYAAHGVVPVMWTSGKPPSDGLLHNQTMTILGDDYPIAPMTNAQIDAMRQGVFHWYASHSASRTADKLMAFVNDGRRHTSIHPARQS
jgi:hypothetical protein